MKSPSKPKQEQKMSPANVRNDPYRNNHFLVEIDGITSASFLSVEGIESLTDVLEYRNGSEASLPRSLPGLHRASNLVLRRGLTENQELWQWRQTVLEGRAERRSGAILILDQTRTPVLRITFREAWPCRWSLSRLDALTKETILEEVELVVEELRLEGV